MNHRLAFLAGVLTTTLIASSPVGAQDWPNEELVISVVTPFAAGGGTDAAIRPLVDEMGKVLPARIAVVNIPGAGSATGTDEVLNRPADGYSILVSGTHTIAATMQGLTDGYHKLDQIAALNWDPFIVAVLASSPYQNLGGLIDAARKTPGKVCLGNAGMGGATGVASIAINQTFDGIFNVTPFNGGQSLRADVLGGRCEAGIFSQSELLSNLDKFRPLVILADEKSKLSAFTQVPTLADAGFQNLKVPGGSFRSFAVRTGTPKNVEKILADAVTKAYQSDAYQKYIAEQGIISTFSTLKDAQSYFNGLVTGYKPIMQEAGLYREK